MFSDKQKYVVVPWLSLNSHYFPFPKILSLEFYSCECRFGHLLERDDNNFSSFISFFAIFSKIKFKFYHNFTLLFPAAGWKRWQQLVFKSSSSKPPPSTILAKCPSFSPLCKCFSPTGKCCFHLSACNCFSPTIKCLCPVCTKASKPPPSAILAKCSSISPPSTLYKQVLCARAHPKANPLLFQADVTVSPNYVVKSKRRFKESSECCQLLRFDERLKEAVLQYSNLQ